MRRVGLSLLIVGGFATLGTWGVVVCTFDESNPDPLAGVRQVSPLLALVGSVIVVGTSIRR